MLEKWLSRKLAITVLSIFTAAVAGAQGAEWWTAALVAGVTIVYVVAQGYVDAVGAQATKVDEILAAFERVVKLAVQGIEEGKTDGR